MLSIYVYLPGRDSRRGHLGLVKYNLQVIQRVIKCEHNLSYIKFVDQRVAKQQQYTFLWWSYPSTKLGQMTRRKGVVYQSVYFQHCREQTLTCNQIFHLSVILGLVTILITHTFCCSEKSLRHSRCFSCISDMWKP